MQTEALPHILPHPGHPHHPVAIHPGHAHAHGSHAPARPGALKLGLMSPVSEHRRIAMTVKCIKEGSANLQLIQRMLATLAGDRGMTYVTRMRIAALQVETCTDFDALYESIITLVNDWRLPRAFQIRLVMAFV